MVDGLPICRVCLKSAMECVDLETPLEDNDGITYREGFNISTQLNALEEDDLPKNLCCSCADELKIVFQFIQRATESDRVLRIKAADQAAQGNESDCSLLLEDKASDVKAENDGSDKTSDEELVVFEIREFPETADVSGSKAEDAECSEEYDLKTEYDDEMTTEQSPRKSKKQSSKKNKKLLLCNVCGKTCSQKSTLESHLLKHKGERPHKCNQCNKSYFTKNGLQMHLVHHTNTAEQKKFICDICTKGFATAQRLRVHNLTHTGEKNFECDFCPKRFATQFRLRSHLRTHTGERPYECNVCGIKFNQSNALKCHMRIHTGEKPYECKVCGKRFSQNTILKTHMTLHTGKTVKCPNCDKKFSRPSYLILHQREHTGEKPYVCPKCPNRYKQKSHLDRHLDTHLGVKHSCTVCGKQYSKKSSLKIHMFTHVEEKPFHCDCCAMSFTRRDKYRNHLKKAHDKDLINNEVANIGDCAKNDHKNDESYLGISNMLVSVADGEIHGTSARSESGEDLSSDTNTILIMHIPRDKLEKIMSLLDLELT